MKHNLDKYLTRLYLISGKAFGDIIRSFIGPRAMLKTQMDPMGRILITNDGNAVLREITVRHPAARSILKIACKLNEDFGDGTKSVIVLAGEFLSVAEQFLKQKIHPIIITRAYHQALEDMLNVINNEYSISVPVDDESKLIEAIQSCVSTESNGRLTHLACKIALNAVKTVLIKEEGHIKIDINRFVKIEKMSGGAIEDSEVLSGIMLTNKDVIHPKMRRFILNPKIILLNCPLEYIKGVNQTKFKIVRKRSIEKLYEIEEAYIRKICADITVLKPDLVCTEKGVSDLAQHFLLKNGISVIKCIKTSDIHRIAKACNASIVSCTDELNENHIGIDAGRFEVKKIGDEYFSFITECNNPKACTILLRGPSRDILNEVEKNLQNAMYVAKNIILNPKLVTGGGSIDMAISQALMNRSCHVDSEIQWMYKAIAQALEVIPRTLLQNCDISPLKTMSLLRFKHSIKGSEYLGINGKTGEMTNMKDLIVWEPIVVKSQVYTTAIKTAIILISIDDIVSGAKNEDSNSPPNLSAESTK